MAMGIYLFIVAGWEFRILYCVFPPPRHLRKWILLLGSTPTVTASEPDGAVFEQMVGAILARWQAQYACGRSSVMGSAPPSGNTTYSWVPCPF